MSSPTVPTAPAVDPPPAPVVYAVKSRPVVVTPPPPEEVPSGTPNNANAVVDSVESKEALTGQSSSTSNDPPQATETKSTILSAALNGERKGPPQLLAITNAPHSGANSAGVEENGLETKKQNKGSYAYPTRRFHNTKTIQATVRKSTEGIPSNLPLVSARAASTTPVSDATKNALGSDGNGAYGKRRNSMPAISGAATSRKSGRVGPVAKTFKKWQCPAVFQNCLQTFYTEQDLDEHIATHKDHGVCRYKCDFCGREFAHSQALDLHCTESHKGHKPIPHQCKFCPEQQDSSQGVSNSSVNPTRVGNADAAPKLVGRQSKEPGAEQIEQVEKGHSLPIKKRGHRQSRPSSSDGQSKSHPEVVVENGGVVEKNGETSAVDKKEHVASSSTMTPGTSPSAVGVGARTQRKRNHPKWMDNMVMEFDLPQSTVLIGKAASAVAATSATAVPAANRAVTARKSTLEAVVSEMNKASSAAQRAQRDRSKSASDSMSGSGKKGGTPQTNDKDMNEDSRSKKRSSKSSPAKRKAVSPRGRGKAGASKISKNELVTESSETSSQACNGQMDNKGKSRQSIDKMFEEFHGMEVDKEEPEVEPNDEVVSKALNTLNKANSLRERHPVIKNQSSVVLNKANPKVSLQDIGENIKDSKTAASNETSPPILNAVYQDTKNEQCSRKEDKIPMPQLISSDVNSDNQSTSSTKPSETTGTSLVKDVESNGTTDAATGLATKSVIATESEVPAQNMKSSNRSEISTRGRTYPLIQEIATTATITTRSTRHSKNQITLPQESGKKSDESLTPGTASKQGKPETALNGTATKDVKQLKTKLSLRSSEKEKSKVPEKAVPNISSKKEEQQLISDPMPRVTVNDMKSSDEVFVTRKRKVEAVKNEAPGELSKFVEQNQLSSSVDVSGLTKKLKGTTTPEIFVATENVTGLEEKPDAETSATGARNSGSSTESQKTSDVVGSTHSTISNGIGDNTQMVGTEPMNNTDKVHFDGMPKLLVEESAPTAHATNKDEEMDDSESDSDIEPQYKNLQLPSPANRRQSADPFIKDEAIRFLCNKVSNRNMLRIRNELMTLKKKGNYFKLTKTAPLAAGLIHDMFCHSFNLPEEDFK